MSIKRHPEVVAIERKKIHMMRRGPSGAGGDRVGTIDRWYVTLAFGEIRKKLAVSEEAVRWLRGELP